MIQVILLLAVLVTAAPAVPIRHYKTQPEPSILQNNNDQATIANPSDTQYDSLPPLQESLSHVMAVLREHQSHIKQQAESHVAYYDMSRATVATDFVVQEDGDSENNIIVVDRKEDPQPGDGGDGGVQDPPTGNDDVDTGSDEEEVELGNGRTSLGAAPVPSGTPTPSVTPFRTPAPTVARNQFAPLSAHEFANAARMHRNDLRNSASRTALDTNLDDGEARDDNFEKAWESVLTAARDGLPNDHPLMERFV